MLYVVGTLAAVDVAVIVAVAALGWGGPLSLGRRLGLVTIAGGIVWAAPARAFAGSVGVGDALLFAGFLLYLIDAHGLRLWRSIDGLDGAVDGRIGCRRPPSA